MAKLIVASCVALCAFVGVASAEERRCSALREGELFLEWSDGTPRGVRLAPTGAAWRLTRLPDGIYQLHCPGCGEGNGASAWLAVRLRDPSASNSGRLFVSDIAGDLLRHAQVAIIANIVKAGPAPGTLFGVNGQTAAVEVKLRDQRVMVMTTMTAIEGCLTFHATLFDATTADSNSFAAALAVERYQPGIDRR